MQDILIKDCLKDIYPKDRQDLIQLLVHDGYAFFSPECLKKGEYTIKFDDRYVAVYFRGKRVQFCPITRLRIVKVDFLIEGVPK